jgi:hypothetical protein
MKGNVNKTWLIYIGAFILAVFVTFTAIQLVSPVTRVNAEDIDNGKTNSLTVATAEEASKIVGFQVAAVSNVPDELKKPDYFAVYEVKKGAWEIAQQWGIPGQGPLLGIIQTKHGNLTGADLESFSYKNISGIRHYVLATDGKIGRIDMFWKNGDVGYYLFANLTGSLDVNIVMEIANSVVIE